MTKLLRNITVLVLFLISFSSTGSELKAEKDAILKRDTRNNVVQFSLSTSGNNLNLCIDNVSDKASPMDVFRVLLQAADQLKSHHFEKVILCFRNQSRFLLKGKDFTVIGKEFGSQNPMYILRTFPEKLSLPDGNRAYESHQGGVLYLLSAQMADFRDMSARWYLNDITAEKRAKIDAKRPKKFAPDDEVF